MRYVIDAATVSALHTWSAQKRALFLTRQESVPSILGKIKTQQSAAGAGDARMRQKWPEVFAGDGLVVEEVIRVLRELPRLTVTYYYVLRSPWRVPVHEQASDLGIRVREFWRQLELAEASVESCLRVIGGRETVHTPQNPRGTVTCA